jgi:hypothetical protein
MTIGTSCIMIFYTNCPYVCIDIPPYPAAASAFVNDFLLTGRMALVSHQGLNRKFNFLSLSKHMLESVI